ncbi:hypothetical protein ACHWQZ_G010324 [Mnemiopsis leidyi]
MMQPPPTYQDGPGISPGYPPPHPGAGGAGYPPPQPSYPGAHGAGYPPYPSVPPTVVVQPVVFGRFPVNMVCPNCQQNIQTKIDYEIGLLTWIIGCFFCFLAFCIDACKDVVHSCPVCNSFLGRKAAL